ncbi:haloacetate dehalogenase [Sorangium cellulosum]|uniref:Haloacetate dehalogenase n=1 Tax=Sorangium cellulosum TaxID=56 RepID=A0A150PEN3_SORCE|nr:haloacetate dehalogenase [Sorangium cellulosum]
MLSRRRGFLDLLTGITATGLLGSAPLAMTASCAAAPGPARPPPARSKIKAIAFDAFAILDPRPIAALAEELSPGKGALLSEAWRTRQFEYTWLRVASGEYADFWRVTRDALVFAERLLSLDLGEEKRARLLGAYLDLEAWPDAAPALRSLEDAGLRLSFLSNFTPRMLDAAIEGAGLGGLFEHVLSTDRARTYKPDPRAYRMALDAFHLEREEILFVPFAGWDAAGARWFGYPTFWVNRLGLPAEELGVTADATGASLADLVELVTVGP